MKLSVIMPTISWDGSFAICGTRIKDLIEADGQQNDEIEFFVVFDGPFASPPDWLRSPAIQVLATGMRSGPAAARNLAAREATGDVLVFVDADVELHQESLGQIRQAFTKDHSLDALFGSYDANPAASGVVSRFRNLLHHHTHHQHPGEACTFWAGCGAMRRSRFLELGGFDTRYEKPSIEDVELGLRLWRKGGRLILDPTIQGCHHKRWTLRSMVCTDIQQRAIPWSRWILEQGENPATLNLSWTGRLSGGLALLVPVALVLTILPGTRWLGLAIAASALLALVLLNLSFHRLHLKRCGSAEALAGVGLHILHLLCASGTFLLMASHHLLLLQPMGWPQGLRRYPSVRRALVGLALGTLAVIAALVLLKGLAMGLSDAKDLRERLQEWQLFRDGFFPISRIYQGHPPPGLRTSPYPAWAIPLFGLLFHPWGLRQGLISIQILSLTALVFIAFTGYHYLRPYGRVAAWFGALAPLAFNGHVEAFAMAQFSILIMALIVLQWLLLNRQRPLAAGFCWALAMVKPQIALLHAAPFFRERMNRKGLWIGLSLLASLSAIALIHTHLNPLTYGQIFFHVLGQVQDDSGWNLLLQLSRFSPLWLMVLSAISLATILVIFRSLPLLKRVAMAGSTYPEPRRWMTQAGLCSLAGFLAFYHRSTDSIMLAPTLWALADLSLRERRLWITLLTLLLGATLWGPTRLFLSPSLAIAQMGIWSLCILVLAVACVRAK